MIGERKNIMKTTGIKVNGYRLAVIGLVLGLAMTMQAVDYKNVYKHSVVSHQYSDNGIEAATPSTGFRSTSAYSGQWNQDAQQSMLNADGTVNEDAYGIGQRNAPGPRRVGQTGTPGAEGEQQPLGDILWPLMLMAMMYAAVRVLRRKPESR